MDERETSIRVGTEVSSAIARAGVPLTAVEEAIGLTSSEMKARLEGVTVFSVPELVVIGGLLRVSGLELVGDAA